MFQKNVRKTYLLTDLLADKVIRRGALLLKTLFETRLLICFLIPSLTQFFGSTNFNFNFEGSKVILILAKF